MLGCNGHTARFRGHKDTKHDSLLRQHQTTGSGDIDVKEYCKSGELTVGLQGSGDVKIKNIESTSTNAELSGSGDMELSGDTQTAVLTLNNSGNIRADKMKAQTVKATVKGSGDITCYATEELVGMFWEVEVSDIKENQKSKAPQRLNLYKINTLSN